MQSGQLLALPAGILGQEGNLWKVEIDRLDEPLVPEAAVCVVADRFPSYEAIRGVIAQGAISSAEQREQSRSVVAVAVARTVTFPSPTSPPDLLPVDCPAASFSS